MAGKRSPQLARFLSDFTLGFSDGLTVPFALSAGLSSLGRTDTVIEAGVAELCAGSISMGIGGYLAARDELAAQRDHQQHQALASSDDDLNEKGDERKGMLSRSSSSASGSLDEKHHHHNDDDDDDDRDTHEEVLRQYLVPLALPRDLSEDILAHLRSSGPDRAARRIIAVKRDEQADSGSEGQGHLPVTPIASGLFISLGYVVGGLIPLLPYIFTSDVALGLIWSIVVCLVSLFLFGVGKTWLLRGGGILAQWKQCVWEGMQMLVLGSLAAGASALCVMLVGEKR